MAYELTKAGIPCVCLEAGPFHKKEDYVNDEWGAFLQMAWLDARTTSGNWRVAKDFSGLPTWLCKAVGGTTTHWAELLQDLWIMNLKLNLLMEM